MATESKNSPSNPILIDQLTPSTTRAEFEQLVDTIITPEDRILFGPSAKDFIIQSLLYPAVFAPKPATFESEAYATVIDDVVAVGGFDDMDRSIDPDRIDRLLWISRDNGIIEVEADGRLTITSEVKAILDPILSQYD